MSGLYSAHLLVPELDYQVLRNDEGDSFVQVTQGSANFGVSGNGFELNDDKMLETIGIRNTPGSGWGFDLGFTYEHRPRYADYQFIANGEELTDHAQNKYKYRIGAALLDIGSIIYNNPQQVRNYELSRNNLVLNDQAFEDLSLTNVGTAIEEALDAKPSEKKTSIRSGLPTALHLNFDYRFSRVLFINAAVLQNLRGIESISMRQNSILAIAPRIEGKSAELAVPVAFINDYRDLAVGVMLRFGPFLVGSNNLSLLLKDEKTVGADLYVGLGFGFGTGGQKQNVEKRERKRAEKLLNSQKSP